jgi:hypothetical protein
LFVRTGLPEKLRLGKRAAVTGLEALLKRSRRNAKAALLYIDIHALRPGTIGACVLALFCAGSATALRLAIDPYVVGVQFISFFPAVIITTLISGFRAGVFLHCAQRRCGQFLFDRAALLFLH